MRGAPYLIAVLFVLVVGAALYFREASVRREPTPAQPAAQRAEAPPQNTGAPQPPPDSSLREVRHPLPQVAQPAGAESKPLPPLAASDEAMREALTGPLGERPVGDLVISKDIARRIVATVDNLPRQKASTQLMPLKAPARQLAINRISLPACASSIGTRLDGR